MPIAELIASPEAWVALTTLIVMEVVLGIDNLLFISIVTAQVPEHQQRQARLIGIGGALILRLALLATVDWITELTYDVVTLFGASFSWKDLILIAGGLFLVWKATKEIHGRVDPDGENEGSKAGSLTIAAAIGQILILDLVFSLDSVITAVGMTPHLPIMMTAIIISIVAMLFAANPLAEFVKRNPTVVMLALGFLLMIGMTLMAEGFGHEVPKGYIYAAMAFSALVEALNMAARRAKRNRATGRGAG
ncbi:MAG: TerC family protein [Pseudomonadota bacterium]